MARFESRRDDPFKQHKLTDEDWRNREQWDLYYVTVNQMVQRTSTPQAPWHIIAGNHKYHARVQVVQTVTEAMERALKKR